MSFQNEVEHLLRDLQSIVEGSDEGESSKERVRALFATGRERLAGLATKVAKSPAIQKVQEVRRKVITGDKDKRVRDFVNETPVVRKIDKLSFTLGVTCLALTQYVLLIHPTWFGLYYTVLVGSLLSLRYYLYKRDKFAYFMWDFCYFTNFLCLLCYFWPSPWLARLCFVLANGPLAWAIAAWRNALVFHSVDKTTSVFIHAFPALLTFCWRWLDVAPERDMCATDAPPGDDGCALGWHGAVVAPYLAYFAWQLVYLAKTEVVDRHVIAGDLAQQTSIRWLARARGGLTLTTLRACQALHIMAPGERFDSESMKTKLIFMTTQFLFTVLTLLPCTFMFDSYLVHVLFLHFIFVACVYNGACYYIEVFAAKYNLLHPKPEMLPSAPKASTADSHSHSLSADKSIDDGVLQMEPITTALGAADHVMTAVAEDQRPAEKAKVV